MRDASAKPRAARAKALCAEKPSSSATAGRERVWPSIRRTTNSALRADNIAKCHAAGCAPLVTRAPVAAQTFGHVLDRTSPDDEARTAPASLPAVAKTHRPSANQRPSFPQGGCSRSRGTRSAEDEQRQGRSVLAHDHSAPVHRLYMHRLERLHGAIASVGAYPGELTAILDLAAGRRSSSRPEVITNALACPPFEPTADSSGLDGS